METIPSKRRDELLVSMQLEYFIKSRSHNKEEIKNEIYEAIALYPESPQLHRIKEEYESDKNRFCVN